MKKRWLSLFVAAVMVFSMFPASTVAVDEPLAGGLPNDGLFEGKPGVSIFLPETGLIHDNQVIEGAQLPDGMSYVYDEEREVHVLTLENMTLTEPLSVDGWNESGQLPKVEIILKGENVMDTRGGDYGVKALH